MGNAKAQGQRKPIYLVLTAVIGHTSAIFLGFLYAFTFFAFAILDWLALFGCQRRNHFISFISASSMIGMTLGVMVLILVLSVMNGFDRELRERILGMVPHAVLYERGGFKLAGIGAKVNAMPGVVASAPLIRSQGYVGARRACTGRDDYRHRP